MRGKGKFKVKRGGHRTLSSFGGDDYDEGVSLPEQPQRPDISSDESGSEANENKSDSESSGEKKTSFSENAVGKKKMLPNKASVKRNDSGNQNEGNGETEVEVEVEKTTQSMKRVQIGGNRKEREALALKEAKERYMKMHLEGKTDQAKADLARLARIRKEREEALKTKEKERIEKEAASRRRRD